MTNDNLDMTAAETECSYYENEYNDYIEDGIISEIYLCNGVIQKNFANKLKFVSNSLMSELISGSDRHKIDDDYTVYSGASGVALLYFILGSYQTCGEYLLNSLYKLRAIPYMRHERIGFLGGDAGPMALMAVIHHKMGNPGFSRMFVDRLNAILPVIINKSSQASNGLFNGRCGYLFAQLFLNHYIGPGTIPREAICSVVNIILSIGKEQSIKRHCDEAPLVFENQDGTVDYSTLNGVVGILNILLQAQRYVSHQDLIELIKPTVDYIACEVLPTSSPYVTTYSMVQWCCGAPGTVIMLCEAYQVFSDQQYLRAAIHCSEIVWRRGILKDGNGLCHGVSGNAYAFLEVYNCTKDLAYLHRACVFADWCADSWYHVRENCSSFSLFEGISGIIYFLNDVLEPESAALPGFSLRPLPVSYLADLSMAVTLEGTL